MKLSESNLSPIDVVGIELKAAMLTIGVSAKFTPADNDLWARKCSALLSRPAIEPLLLVHWRRLRNFQMSEAQIARFCSLSCGSEQCSRSGESYGLWHGGDVRFEDPEQARQWWNDIQAVANKPELKPLLPFYCYARTIIAHPFPDGNGRLARALLTAALARGGDLQFPPLALAPSFYRNAAAIAKGVRQLSRDGQWDRFASILLAVLADAQTVTQRMLAN